MFGRGSCALAKIDRSEAHSVTDRAQEFLAAGFLGGIAWHGSCPVAMR